MGSKKSWDSWGTIGLRAVTLKIVLCSNQSKIHRAAKRMDYKPKWRGERDTIMICLISLISCSGLPVGETFSLFVFVLNSHCSQWFLSPPLTQTYQYKLHLTLLYQTKAVIHEQCRYGTAAWTQCPCLEFGLVCGSTWPAEGSRITCVAKWMTSTTSKWLTVQNMTNDDTLLTK